MTFRQAWDPHPAKQKKIEELVVPLISPATFSHGCLWQEGRPPPLHGGPCLCAHGQVSLSTRPRLFGAGGIRGGSRPPEGLLDLANGAGEAGLATQGPRGGTGPQPRPHRSVAQKGKGSWNVAGGKVICTEAWLKLHGISYGKYAKARPRKPSRVIAASRPLHDVPDRRKSRPPQRWLGFPDAAA